MELQIIENDRHPLAVVSNWMATDPGKLKALMPDGVDPMRMLHQFNSHVRTNDSIAECEPASIMTALGKAAQLGLELGVNNQASLVKYGKQCQLIIGFQGLIRLAMLNGGVDSVDTNVVKQGDEYSRDQDGFTHSYDPFSPDREDEPIIGAYCTLHLTSGGKVTETMSRKEIDEIKNEVRNKGVWNKHYAEMARKTVIRRAIKRINLSPIAQEVVAADDKHQFTANVIHEPMGSSAVLERLTGGEDGKVNS